MEPKLTQPQHQILAELRGGAFIFQFETPYGRTSTGRTINKATLDALRREKVIKVGPVQAPEHGAKDLQVWIACSQNDPEAGKLPGEPTKDDAAIAQALSTKVESYTTKFMALSAVTDQGVRRQQIESLVKQLLGVTRP